VTLIEDLCSAIAAGQESGGYPAEVSLAIPRSKRDQIRQALGKFNSDRIGHIPRGRLLLMSLQLGSANDYAVFALFGQPRTDRPGDQYVSYAETLA
jgi:hypothetical protein